MKCNYHPPKLTKEEQQDMRAIKSTLPYIDRMQIEKRHWCEVRAEDSNDVCSKNIGGICYDYCKRFM